MSEEEAESEWTRHGSYVLPQLVRVIDQLAVLPGDVRSRLAEAYQFLIVEPDQLPRSVREDFKEVNARLTKYPDDSPFQNQSSIVASCRRMKNKTGARLASKLKDIRDRLREIEREKRTQNQ